jgi:hypothetical protein
MNFITEFNPIERLHILQQCIAKVRMQIRKSKKSKINWQFTTKDSRIKLKKLYPSIND